MIPPPHFLQVVLMWNCGVQEMKMGNAALWEKYSTVFRFNTAY